jgi:hypothetical protein
MDKEQHLEYFEYLKYIAKTDPSGKPSRRVGAFDFGKYVTNAELSEKYKDRLVSKGWIKE